MAQSVPQVQLLEKDDYTKQELVSIPDAYPLPPLAASSLRLRSRILALTTNNFSYARFGGVLGWWNIWPMPPTLASSMDTSRYCRISAWGYGEITESTHPDVAIGTIVYGYLPIGDYPEAIEVDVDGESGHIVARRPDQMTFYNRYFPEPPGTYLTKDEDLRAWDTMMRQAFGSAYVLNRYGFAWEDGRNCHPFGTEASWSREDADIAGAVVIMLAPSGKTGLLVAQQLRQARPTEQQPKRIVAVGSAASRAFSEGTGLFDEVLLYEDFAAGDIAERLGAKKETRVLIVNFAARGTADSDWLDALRPVVGRVTALIVGGDPTLSGRSKLAGLAEDTRSGVLRMNASGLRDLAVAVDGPTRFFEEQAGEWARFKKTAEIKGLDIQLGTGVQEFAAGWTGLCQGEYGPAVGLVYNV